MLTFALVCFRGAKKSRGLRFSPSILGSVTLASGTPAKQAQRVGVVDGYCSQRPVVPDDGMEIRVVNRGMVTSSSSRNMSLGVVLT